MSANSSQLKRRQRHREVDARVGNALIEVKFGVDALRTIRTSLMQVAYPLSEDPVSEGFVVLVDSPITMERLRDEWEAPPPFCEMMFFAASPFVCSRKDASPAFLTTRMQTCSAYSRRLLNQSAEKPLPHERTTPSLFSSSCSIAGSPAVKQ